LANLERIKLKNNSSANVIKSYVKRAELISLQAKKIIDEEKKLMPKYYQNLYYKRRNLFGYGSNRPVNCLNSKINYCPSKLVFSGRGRELLRGN
jgi:hypothetical protein